eukprot:GHVN01012839.1.p1 GENE.GHVN01012839.1~~GHVN01012839.1.p1  ORF type:complete len:873 (+),score=132.59 GHVN01012839.1:1491-4109(+)
MVGVTESHLDKPFSHNFSMLTEEESREGLQTKVNNLEKRLRAKCEDLTETRAALGAKNEEQRPLEGRKVDMLLRHIENLQTNLNRLSHDKRLADMTAAAALIEMDKHYVQSTVTEGQLGSFTGAAGGLPVPEELFYLTSPPPRRPQLNVTIDRVKDVTDAEPVVAEETSDVVQEKRSTLHKTPISSTVVKHDVDFGEMMQATTTHNVYKPQQTAPVAQSQGFAPFTEHTHTKKKTKERGSEDKGRHEESASESESNFDGETEMEVLRRNNKQLMRDHQDMMNQRAAIQREVQMMELQWVQRNVKRTEETHSGRGAKRARQERLREERLSGKTGAMTGGGTDVSSATSRVEDTSTSPPLAAEAPTAVPSPKDGRRKFGAEAEHEETNKKESLSFREMVIGELNALKQTNRQLQETVERSLAGTRRSDGSGGRVTQPQGVPLQKPNVQFQLQPKIQPQVLPQVQPQAQTQHQSQGQSQVQPQQQHHHNSPFNYQTLVKEATQPTTYPDPSLSSRQLLPETWTPPPSIEVGGDSRPVGWTPSQTTQYPYSYQPSTIRVPVPLSSAQVFEISPRFSRSPSPPPASSPHPFNSALMSRQVAHGGSAFRPTNVEGHLPPHSSQPSYQAAVEPATFAQPGNLARFSQPTDHNPPPTFSQPTYPARPTLYSRPPHSPQQKSSSSGRHPSPIPHPMSYLESPVRPTPPDTPPTSSLGVGYNSPTHKGANPQTRYPATTFLQDSRFRIQQNSLTHQLTGLYQPTPLQRPRCTASSPTQQLPPVSPKSFKPQQPAVFHEYLASVSQPATNVSHSKSQATLTHNKYSPLNGQPNRQPASHYSPSSYAQKSPPPQFQRPRSSYNAPQMQPPQNMQHLGGSFWWPS